MENYIENFMASAIEVAITNPAAPYGSIVVYNDKEILLRSANKAHSNPIMHGELSVIYDLFKNGFDGDVKKLSIYTTAEPCPMCAAAIYWAMIPKVIYGSSISFLHELFGRQILLNAEDVLNKTPNFYRCNLIGGIKENECNALFLEAKKISEIG